MSLRTGGQKEQPPPMAKKDGLRRRLSHLFSRSEVSLKELGKREPEENCSRLVGARNYPAGWDKVQRRKTPRKQRPTEKVSEEDVSTMPGKPGKSPISSKSQQSASKVRALSYSEPDLWRNGFLRKFGGLAWRKQRNNHLQIPTSGPWPLGRLQRPAVGSDVDMRGRSDSGPTLNDIRTQERLRPTSQPSDIDSVGTSPVQSTSFDSLLRCGDGSSWEGSFSLSNPSLSCSAAPEMKREVLMLPSVLKETSKAPLSEWAESALNGYLSSGFSHISLTEEPENVSFSSGLGESIPEQVSGMEEPKIAPPSPPVEQPLKVEEAPQTNLAKKNSRIRYEIRITLTKGEDKENGMDEGELIAGCGQRALPSHPCGEGTLSLGVAELEETEEQRHPKLAQPAPQLSARKEFQNGTGLHRVGTCKVCRRILTSDTGNPEATATAALQWDSETRQGEGKDPTPTGELQSGDGTPEEGTDIIASDFSADSFSKSSRSLQVSSERELDPKRPCDIRSGLFCIQPSMEKVTVSSHRAEKDSSSVSFKWQKTDLPNQETKPSFSKITSASQMTEKAGARSHSPSRVSILLEAWEKGLVGTDTTESPSPSDSRRSRSPVHSKRLRFSKEASRPLFPSNPKSSLSPVRPSVNARRSISPADTRRSFSPADNRRSLSPTRFPADTRRSHSPAYARRSLSPANARQLLSPVQSRRSLFLGDARRSRSPTKTRPSSSLADNKLSRSPADTRRSLSPAGTGRSYSPADASQPLSPSNARHSCLPGDTQGLSSSADVRNPSSPAESQNSSSTAENHHSSSPVKSPSSPSPDTRSLPSVADIRRLYSSGNAKCLSSPKDIRQPRSSAESGQSSSSANTRYPSSLEERRHPSASAQTKDSSSPEDTRWPFPPAETRCSFSPTDARLSSSPADAKFSSSPSDGSGSPSPPESRTFSSTSFGKRSHALSPPKDFTTHGPVFAQVYSPSPKPKILIKTELQDTNSTTAGQSQGENHCGVATDTHPASEYQQEREIHITDGSREENLTLTPVSTRIAEFQRKSYTSNGISPPTVTASPRECNLPNTTLLTGQTESYPSRSGNSIYFSGGNYMPSVMNTQTSAGPCVLSPLPHTVSSSTVVRSQTEWYSPKGSNMVVFRSDRQVIVPQAGTTTVYRAGREIVMSSSGTDNGSKSQQEESLTSSSVTCISPKENWQPRDDLHDTKSPKVTPASFSDACNQSAVSSQLESCMTQSGSTSMSDAQRQRCTLLPNPAFTSNRDATTFEEGVVPFSTAQRDCSVHSKPVFQRNSNLSSRETATRSERGKSMTDPGDSVANGPEQDSNLSKEEMASLSGSQRIWGPLDAEEEISVSRNSSGSQEIAPQDQKLTSQTELIEEQHSPRKDSLAFTPDPNITLAETTNSSEEPPSHKNGNRNNMAEPEPEELVDMELFVDTLRNMEPAELKKPLKLLPRTTRPSTLAKHTVLPPIHEDHITPKSQVRLPAALGELFALTEEKNSEEREDLKKEDIGFAEEEEIENPYRSMDEKQQEKEQARKSYPWENKSFKTEEEIGSFLGKLQQGLGDQEANVLAPKALANQTNLIRANILKGISLLSGLPDKKVVEDNKPYSRLDNSLLYSRFISPQSQFREATKGKDMRCSIIFLNPSAPKGNNAHQTFPSGIQTENAHEHRSSKSSPSATQAEPFSRMSGASRSSKEMTVQSKGTESPSRSAGQVSKSRLCSKQQEENKLPKKVNVRPGKIILYSESGFGGQKREIWGDVTDATAWPLSHTISIRVVRGGWVMYEKPRFYGRKCVLAEGDVEITNPWRMYNRDGADAEDALFRIGSLKRVVRDYKIPEISLFSEENGEGTKQRFTDSSEDTRMYNEPLRAASIIVYSGLWLVYSKPFFDDDPYVLEPGGYPSLQAWGAKDPSVCSIHPIKLGCPVVEKPGEPKAVIYERPHFQGHSWEVSRDIYNVKKPENNQDSGMPTAGSLRIMGGCWVGYEKEGFRGHQYLLEEGEYYDWSQWGGYNEQLVSLRLIRTDFLDPALVLFEAMDFEEGPSIELSEALPDVELASYGTMTQSIHVLSGVWVAYEDKNFSGEQYILEKGVYRNCEDWGASNCQISSVQPILQVGEHSLHFVAKIQLFSEPDFLGNYISFEEDQVLLPENFNPRSCRVNGGSWILYDGTQFDGEQHVLSEGEYPTLTSMGCLFTTAIRSLKKVPIFFSEPSIFLHGLECFEGKEIELNAEVRSLQAEGFNNHVLSVRVKGGIWVLCEHSDFRGRQWLLDRMEITNWLTYSGLQHIGSLYPIKQKRIYFQIKNEELKSFLSVPDDVEDMKAGRVLVSELSDSSSSIWYYEDGLLKNQAAANMSLQVIGPAGKGSKVVLWSESRVPRQTWRIDSSGRICSQMFEDKVLDVKGGRAYDQDHAILWDSSEERPTQIWHIQVL